MTMTDPIADMLTRVRNANIAKHDDVSMPSSKLKEALAELLKTEGYIADFKTAERPDKPGKILSIDMKYSPDRERTITGIKRVSKPGLRVYKKRSEEHTSELQSLMRISYAVFCLKKKKE